MVWSPLQAVVYWSLYSGVVESTLFIENHLLGCGERLISYHNMTCFHNLEDFCLSFYHYEKLKSHTSFVLKSQKCIASLYFVEIGQDDVIEI